MSPEEIKSKANTESSDNKILKQALIMTEVAMDLKDRYIASEKYLHYLKTMLNEAEKTISALHATSKSSLHLAQNLLQMNMNVSKLPEDIKHEYQNLHNVIERQLNSFDVDVSHESGVLNVDQLSEKIRALEAKNKNSDNNIILQNNLSSTRNFKIDIDEKYPENLSRESLIDLNNVSNLPPVPEDIFTSFSNNKPIRSSSLSSLKSMRKIKLFLQKAESSDDEDSSDNDEHDYSRLVYGDSDENKTSGSHSPSTKKLHLGYIKEESQD